MSKSKPDISRSSRVCQAAGANQWPIGKRSGAYEDQELMDFIEHVSMTNFVD